jgi:hypothetical protein
MTDIEIAVELATRLFKAKLIVESANIELQLSRDQRPNARSVSQIAQDVEKQVLLPVYVGRIAELRQKLAASTPADVLHTLHESLQELLEYSYPLGTPLQE